MDAIRGDVDSIPRSKGKVIHQQHPNEIPIIELGVLLRKPSQHPRRIRIRPELRLGDTLQRLDGLCHFRRRSTQQRLTGQHQCFVRELRVLREEAFERFQFHQLLNILERFPAGEELEFRQRDGDLGFVVVVSKFLGVDFVQFFGELFVWVDLEGEGFGEGEDLFVYLCISFILESLREERQYNTFGIKGISAPYLSNTDLPINWGFFCRNVCSNSPDEST